MFDLFSVLIRLRIEKCSESTGIKLVWFLFNSFLINDHPQIIDSLLAIAIFLLNLIISNVGNSPSKPVIEDIV